jgi:hypothetical protein
MTPAKVSIALVEGEKADGARKKVSKSAGKMLRIRKGKDENDVTQGASEAADRDEVAGAAEIADQT